MDYYKCIHPYKKQGWKKGEIRTYEDCLVHYDNNDVIFCYYYWKKIEVEDLTNKFNSYKNLTERIELPIGKIFIYKNNFIEVCKWKENVTTCTEQCIFHSEIRSCGDSACLKDERKYAKRVYFKKLGNVKNLNK